jgi:hypothetical protein
MMDEFVHSLQRGFDSEECDTILASAVRFLIDGGEEDAASVLLSCELRIWYSGDTAWVEDETYHALHVSLRAPRYAYEILGDSNHPITQAVRQALDALLPELTYIRHFTILAQQIETPPDWREELLQIARGVGVHNQAAQGRNLLTWKNLNFRSQSEIRIAEALDRAGVLFFPNCRCRLGEQAARENREADFLVCYKGKWGILEVDGEPFHPPTRTAQDHERDRLFKKHGILVVEHFDATECYENPDRVVQGFLRILD